MEHGHSAQSEPSAGIAGHGPGGQAYERPSGCNPRAELMRGIRCGGCAIGCATPAVDKTDARITVAGGMVFQAVTEGWSCSDQTATNTWTDTEYIIHSIRFCHVGVDDHPPSFVDPTYDCE